MKRKTIYTNAPADIDAALDAAVRIKDFLPSPEELAHSYAKKKLAGKVRLGA